MSSADEAFRAAVLAGDLEEVRAAIDAGADLDRVIGEKRSKREVYRDISPLGFTAMHVAAYENDAPLCSLLLERGADPVRPSRQGWLPLEIAVDWRSPAVVDAMLEAGVDPDAPSRFSGPLALSAASGDVAVVKRLLDVGARRNIAAALANSCASNGDPAITRVLLDAGARPAHPPEDSDRWTVRLTALHYRKLECLALLREHTEPEDLIDAAIDGDLDAVRAALAAGVDVDTVREYDVRALTAAAAMGHVAVVEHLLEAGADVDRPSRIFGTPIEIAVIRGRLEAAEVLLAAGASLKGVPSRALNKRCDRATWDWLLERAGPLDADKLLPIAAQSRDAIAVDVLLGRGARPDALDPWDRTALMHAAWSGNLEIVELLLAAGADPKQTDRRGRPIIHYVLIYDDVTLEWDRPDFDPSEYNRDSRLLQRPAVRRLIEAGAPLPWDDER